MGREGKYHSNYTDGIRQDVIDGCRELRIGAMRWPGGCCADHYHWKNGVGTDRYPRLHPIPDPANPVWRHDFGTDEFMRFCSLTGAEPIITVNTATGSPEEFLDWFEYVNGDPATKYGHMRAINGHPEPYNILYWGIGNTDENVWHIDFNNPAAYARDYLTYQTTVRELRNRLYFIGLGLSSRHKLPGWAGRALDIITHQQRQRGPDALSIHHYLGGAKQGRELCGGDTYFTDAQYYATLELLERYRYDIDLHRAIIREHTNPQFPTCICFDEWGLWHPEATIQTNQNQRQTLRDAIFAALTLHIFYRNADIVKLAMETQISNLLQSLFETDGARFYKTPTFYVFKLFLPHLGQRPIDFVLSEFSRDLDIIASSSDDGASITVSAVNLNLFDTITLSLRCDGYETVQADILSSDDIHRYNTFDNPETIHDRPIIPFANGAYLLPPHSISRFIINRQKT